MARQDPNRDELLKKLADRRVIASVSGGKDSAALSLWLTEMGIEHTRCFQDTGWESQLLYDYLRGPLTAAIGPITEVRSKKYPGGMVDLVRGRGMFPSRLQRMCTQELKVFPARDFIKDQQDIHGEVVNAVGIRAEESDARSKMTEWEWNETFDCEVWRPLINWTEADVIAIHQRHSLAPCPLYLGVKGFDGGVHSVNRVGCFPCIFARKAEVRMVAAIDPARVDLIRQLEAETTVRRFAPRALFQARIGRGGEPWPIDLVIAWSKTRTRDKDDEPFVDPNAGCMRWGMCDTAAVADGCSVPSTETNTMRYVMQVSSNIKRGCNVTLGEKTLIVGPTGAGKSTIVNAIELALTGRASDVAGRATLAKDQELATLIRTGDAGGSAVVTLDDGSIVSWALTPGSKSSHSGDAFPEAFPLRDVRENLTGSPETARKWLLGHVAKGLEWTGVLAGIPVALHARVSTLAGGLVLGLPTALEVAKSKAREETKRASDLKAQAQQASAGLPPPLTEAEIEAAKLDATAQAREMLAGVRERGRAAVARVEKLKLDVKAATDALAALPAPSKIAKVGAAVILILDGQIETKAAGCGVCGGATDAGKATARREHVSRLIESAAEVETKRAESATALATTKQLLAGEQSNLVSLAGEVARLNALIDATPEPSIVAERRGQWNVVQDQQAAALAAQRTAGEWGELAEVLAGAVSQIVEKGRAGFEARVQAFMPEGYRFGLDLAETTVRYGLRQGPDGNEGPVRPALSGAEWAIVTSALAAAVLPAGKLSIIVPEDRPFDPASLAATMSAFSAIDAQVIIATPTMPTAVPDGWTVIAVGGEIAKPAEAPAPVAQTVAAPTIEVKKKRGRPSKAELAERAAAAAAQSNAAPASGDLFTPADAGKKCAGCDVRADLSPELHSKLCKIHGDGKIADVIIIKDGKRVADQEPSVPSDISSLFET